MVPDRGRSCLCSPSRPQEGESLLRPLRKPRSAPAWCPRSWRSSSAGVSRPRPSRLAPPAAELALVAKAITRLSGLRKVKGIVREARLGGSRGRRLQVRCIPVPVRMAASGRIVGTAVLGRWFDPRSPHREPPSSARSPASYVAFALARGASTLARPFGAKRSHDLTGAALVGTRRSERPTDGYVIRKMRAPRNRKTRDGSPTSRGPRGRDRRSVENRRLELASLLSTVSAKPRATLDDRFSRAVAVSAHAGAPCVMYCSDVAAGRPFGIRWASEPWRNPPSEP